ncbi:hypothetical protein [Symbiopectobacterium purcellii]|uniref:Uncharacterized protein n=1 Tax=Symbiopectobacterium purcellii TaxID=2871826 RepID=A0ABX9AQL9_9ENTR|nr:hypothetical protein [Symbiopectobacterium purcellii]QZN97489.1 hypothetical protein K6K13_09265 [Symbiopectobacterium purcellii]
MTGIPAAPLPEAAVCPDAYGLFMGCLMMFHRYSFEIAFSLVLVCGFITLLFFI